MHLSPLPTDLEHFCEGKIVAKHINSQKPLLSLILILGSALDPIS